MTMEGYKKASVAVIEIEGLELEIRNIKEIMNKDTNDWIVEVRPNTAWPPIRLDDCGMLIEFLKMILEKKMERLTELMDDFERI